MLLENVKLKKDTVDLVRENKKKTGVSITSFIEMAIDEKINGGLIGKLRDDKDLQFAWQSSIAMSVKDEYSRRRRTKRIISHADMHEIANKGAIDFLNQLLK